jgi:hypothetical protein
LTLYFISFIAHGSWVANNSFSGIRKRVLNHAGASKGKQSIEQIQREFFRKRQKDEELQHSEATMQDSVFEKLEASSLGRKRIHFDQRDPVLLQKQTHVDSSILSDCSRNRPVALQPIAIQPTARKDGKPDTSKLTGLRSSAIDMDELIQIAAPASHHSPQICNPSSPAFPSASCKQLVDDETQTIQTQRHGPIGKLIAYKKSIASQISAPKEGKPDTSKLTGLRSSAIDMDELIQIAAPASHHSPQICNPSSPAFPSALSMDEDGQRKDQMFLAPLLSCNFDIQKPQGAITTDETKKSGTDKKPTDARTHCASEPDVLSFQLENPYQTFDLQLPANYSQMPRTVQYLLSTFFHAANPEHASHFSPGTLIERRKENSFIKHKLQFWKSFAEPNHQL